MKEFIIFMLGYLCGGVMIKMSFSDQIACAKSSTVIVPEVQVKCINNQCDTTYIYKHPEQ